MESRWITGLIIFFVLFILGLCITNAVIYSKISSENKTVGTVTPGGARALMIINILIAVLFLIIFFWYCFKFYRNGEEIYLQNYLKDFNNYTKNKYKNWRNPNSPMQPAIQQEFELAPMGRMSPKQMSPVGNFTPDEASTTVMDAIQNNELMNKICSGYQLKMIE
jgi:hypothetical protein